MRCTSLLALIAAAALAAAAPAIAQMPAHVDVNLAGFNRDPGALPGAITAIEAASNGHVVEIRYSNVGGVPGYDVVLAKGSAVSFMRFAAPGRGLVPLTDKTEPTWMRHWKGREDVSLVRSAKVKLATAVRTAEAAGGNAPAIAAGMAQSATSGSTDVKAYNVAILQGGAQFRVAVDSESGSVIADPAALAPY